MTDAIRAVIKGELERLNKSQRQLAIDLDMAPQYLGEMLNAQTSNVPKRWQQVFDALGLELVVQPKTVGELPASQMPPS
jgi:hypothetical protein